MFTSAGARAQARHEEISGRHNRTHFCGAYWGWGFHEDGVASARCAVAALELAGRSGRDERSAIYEGVIRHRRFAVREHELRHRIALAYVDLDELDGAAAAARRSSSSGARTTSGDPGTRSADAARALGGRTAGPVRLLTNLRTFGHCFNPVSFVYCHDGEDRLQAVIAEVTNTPWGERHAYVLRRSGDGRVLDGDFDKLLHVSPFMGMDHALRDARGRARARRCRCTWRAGVPASSRSTRRWACAGASSRAACWRRSRRAIRPLRCARWR